MNQPFARSKRVGRIMTKKRASAAVVALNVVVLWCGVGYVGLAMGAMHLGEVMHDIHCQDHR